MGTASGCMPGSIARVCKSMRSRKRSVDLRSPASLQARAAGMHTDLHTARPRPYTRGAMGDEPTIHPASRSARATKRDRQQAMRELVARAPIGSQDEFARLLRERGFTITQATVSRDIAELGLVKVPRADRHVYVSPDDLATPATVRDDSLRRLLIDLPLTIRRSGLILLLISTPGSANAIAEAIDRSSLHEQEGTIAGDNTVLVLFADEDRLLRWKERVEVMRSTVGDAARATRPPRSTRATGPARTARPARSTALPSA
jgi:transcriptional regulator of arginine metabolism